MLEAGMAQLPNDREQRVAKEARQPSMIETSRATASAVPPTADIVGHRGHVRKVPIPEVGAPYSITASAVARRAGGTSMPSAFAVLRFTASSNLVGCSTGRSDGFAPLRILSA